MLVPNMNPKKTKKIADEKENNVNLPSSNRK